jgi:hypothetical protein
MSSREMKLVARSEVKTVVVRKVGTSMQGKETEAKMEMDIKCDWWWEQIKVKFPIWTWSA